MGQRHSRGDLNSETSFPYPPRLTTHTHSVLTPFQSPPERSVRSDLMQRWENGSGYIFLERPDAQEEVAIYLKDRDMNAFRATIYITFKRRSIGMSLDRRCSEALCAALNEHRYQINEYHPPPALFDHFLQPIHRPRDLPGFFGPRFA